MSSESASFRWSLALQAVYAIVWGFFWMANVQISYVPKD